MDMDIENVKGVGEAVGAKEGAEEGSRAAGHKSGLGGPKSLWKNKHDKKI